MFIEIKPFLSEKLIKKLLIETKNYKNCVFISFEEKNINYYQDASYGDFPLHSETVDKDGIGIRTAIPLFPGV